MIRRFHKHRHEPKKFYRRNEQINATSLRVLDGEGKQLGVLTKVEALEKARAQGVDLVEIAPTATPPVAKIIDYNKFLYQQEKKEKEEKKNAKVSEVKEVRLGPFMNDHDLMVMIRRATEFLGDNDKVRLVVKFSGRQIAHPEFGQQIMQKVVKQLSSLSKMDRDPHFEGRQYVAILAPERKKNDPTSLKPRGDHTSEA